MFSKKSPKYNYLSSLLIWSQSPNQTKYFKSSPYITPRLKLKNFRSNVIIAMNMGTSKHIVVTFYAVFDAMLIISFPHV